MGQYYLLYVQHNRDMRPTMHKLLFIIGGFAFISINIRHHSFQCDSKSVAVTFTIVQPILMEDVRMVESLESFCATETVWIRPSIHLANITSETLVCSLCGHWHLEWHQRKQNLCSVD